MGNISLLCISTIELWKANSQKVFWANDGCEPTVKKWQNKNRRVPNALQVFIFSLFKWERDKYQSEADYLVSSSSVHKGV